MNPVSPNANTNERVVRVAAGQGFWGDWLEAPRRQVEGGEVDYLMLDYLAEVTMSILQKQKERDPKMGYARDFIGAVESIWPAIAERGVRVIANAGGVNPPACAEAVRQSAERAGVSKSVRIGVVTGDDLLPRLDELIALRTADLETSRAACSEAAQATAETGRIEQVLAGALAEFAVKVDDLARRLDEPAPEVSRKRSKRAKDEKKRKR